MNAGTRILQGSKEAAKGRSLMIVFTARKYMPAKEEKIAIRWTHPRASGNGRLYPANLKTCGVGTVRCVLM